ncbi:PREDICTED: irregular chiasm C-roughest protein-like [Priapulus caudatus]|uniref:Irregular chiasm C-roughest protein-like n=1 Tax=Priapulus caudatus TaxID=37621 RepID=A0ABM1EM28_PRICU|nr:PREDICTED: irregular chiasm C-roughest protein-like [Priapulus caudatus]
MLITGGRVTDKEPFWSIVLLLFFLIDIQIGAAMQRFLVEPQDVNIIKDHTVILPCVVEGAIGVVQWTKDEFGLGNDRKLPYFPRYSLVGNESAGEYNLQVMNVELGDDAIYQCQIGATPSMPAVLSNNAKLNVLVAPNNPEIAEGSKIQVTADVPFNLTCRADGGKPAATLAWHDHSGAPARRERDSLKKMNAVQWINITPTREYAGKAFTCLMHHPALTAPRSVQVQMDVLYAPALRMTVVPYSVREYDNVVVHCQATANPNGIEYRWYRNELLIEEEKGRKMKIYNIGRGYHNDKIRCEARNVVGMSTASHVIEMIYGPKFRNPPASVAVDLGHDATLHCEADGNPRPAIIWHRNGSDSEILSSAPTLTIHKASQHTAGRYICVASVPNFADINAEVVVYIKGSPAITSEGIQKFPEGSNARVECRIEGMPVPKQVVWWHGGRPVDLSDDRFTTLSDEHANIYISRLIVSNMRSEDFGAYNCSADNGYGRAEKIIIVEKTLSLPIVIGSIIGGLILIVLVAIAIVLCNRRRHPDDEAESTYGSVEKNRGRSNMVALSDYKPGSLRSNGAGCGARDTWPIDGRDSLYRMSGASGDYAEPAAYIQKPDNRMNNNGFLHIDDYIHDYGSSQNYVRQPSYRLSNNSLPTQPGYVFSAPPAVDYRNYGNYAAVPRGGGYLPPENYVDETLNPNRLSTRV